MKRLQVRHINPAIARAEYNEYAAFCAGTKTFGERKDVLPFFSSRQDLSLLFAEYIPGIKIADRIAHEFKIYGDFVADLIVGDSAAGKFLLVEFEDGTPASVFVPSGKTAPHWSSRFESAFSQIVDWLWKLEDMRVTNDFLHVFGRRDASFSGLIVIGKDMKLEIQEEHRLKWRQDKVMVDSKGVSVLSYNDFLRDADHLLRLVHRV